MIQLKNPFRKVEKKDYFTGNNNNNKLLKSINRLFGYREYSFSDYDLTKLRQLYSDSKYGNPIVYSIINKRARITAEVFEYVKLRNKKTKKIVEVHPAIDVLNYANDIDNTRSQFIKHISINKDLMGEEFTYKNTKSSTSLEGTRLYSLPTELVSIKKGGITQPIKGFTIQDEKNLMLPSEVMWIKNYNPDPDSDHGLPPLVTASRLIQLIEKGDNRMLNLIENGGIKHILAPKPITGDGAQFGVDEARIDDAEDKLNDKDNAGKTKISNIPLDLIKLGDTAADLGILATSDFAIKVLCFVFDYPYEMFMGTAKYSNQKEAKNLLYTQIGIPQAKIICQALNRFLNLDLLNLEFYIDIDSIDALQEDKQTILNSHVLARTSINERRDVLGLERLKGEEYDKPLMTMGDQLGYNEDDGLGLDDGGGAE